jgi:hypothetical protein
MRSGGLELDQSIRRGGVGVPAERRVLLKARNTEPYQNVNFRKSARKFWPQNPLRKKGTAFPNTEKKQSPPSRQPEIDKRIAFC